MQTCSVCSLENNIQTVLLNFNQLDLCLQFLHTFLFQYLGQLLTLISLTLCTQKGQNCMQFLAFLSAIGLSIGTSKTINLPFVSNGKSMFFRCPNIRASFRRKDGDNYSNIQ